MNIKGTLTEIVPRQTDSRPHKYRIYIEVIGTKKECDITWKLIKEFVDNQKIQQAKGRC